MRPHCVFVLRVKNNAITLTNHVNVNRTMDQFEDQAKICYQRGKRENTRDQDVIVLASVFDWLRGWYHKGHRQSNKAMNMYI